MPQPRMKCWLRTCGVAGFAFFLIKGLAWLTIPAVLIAYRGCTQS